MEAIELYQGYKEEASQSAKPPQLPPLMLAYQSRSPEDFMARMIELVKLPEIEQTLLVLPFDVVLRLIQIIEVLLERRKSVEVVCRMFFFLVEIHYGSLAFAKEQHPLLKRVRDLAKQVRLRSQDRAMMALLSSFQRLDELRDMVGFNTAALQFHVNKMDERQRALELEETVLSVKEKRRKKKNKEKALRTAIISL
jgi:U3 small nucleolar RNA-associated protein 12